MSTENELRKARARLNKRGTNVISALVAGVPTDGKQLAAVTGGAAAAVVAVELLSPVPTTVMAVVGEGVLAIAAACGVKSAIQGRAFWKAAIMGSDADKIAKEEKEEAEPPVAYFCPYCAAEVNDAQVFCIRCGANLDEKAEQRVEETPAEKRPPALDSSLNPVENTVTAWTMSPTETSNWVARQKIQLG